MSINNYYYHEYMKNKKEYFNMSTFQFGGGASYILLDGTSSSGKTSICKMFKKHGYKHISLDDSFEKNYKKIYAGFPYDYTEPEMIFKINAKLMYKEAKKHKKVIFDDVSQLILDVSDKINGKKICVVVVYASLEDLARNIDTRRKKLDPRSIVVFEQFANRYIKADEETDLIVNRQSFIAALKKYVKYEFDNEVNLENFAVTIFDKMLIDDDNYHYVKLRDTFRADYIINTSKKNPQQIYKEIDIATDSCNKVNNKST